MVRRLADAKDQARRNASDVGHHEEFRRAIAEAPVVPVLVLHSAAPAADSLHWLEERGVTIIQADYLRDWLATLEGARHSTPSASIVSKLDEEEHGLKERLTGLGKQQESYRSWTALHPEAARRLDHLVGEIAALDEVLGRTPSARDLPPSLQPERWAELARTQDRSLGLDLGR